MEMSHNFAFENVLVNLNLFFWGGGWGEIGKILVFKIRIHFKFYTKCDLFTGKKFHISEWPLFILIQTKKQICTKTCPRYRKMTFLKFLEIFCQSRNVLLICQNHFILMSIRQTEQSLPKNCSYLVSSQYHCE